MNEFNINKFSHLMHQWIWINVGSGGFILNTFLPIRNSSADFIKPTPLESEVDQMFNIYLPSKFTSMVSNIVEYLTNFRCSKGQAQCEFQHCYGNIRLWISLAADAELTLYEVTCDWRLKSRNWRRESTIVLHGWIVWSLSAIHLKSIPLLWDW